MRRRTFFRSASEKKSTRKQQQLKNQKEEQLRNLQIKHGQVDRLQASSSNNVSDPPQNLDGPARSAPKVSSSGEQHYISSDSNYALNDPNSHPVQVQGNYVYHQQPPQYRDQTYGFQQNVEHQRIYSNEGMQIGYDQMHHQQQVAYGPAYGFQQNVEHQQIYPNEGIQMGYDQMHQHHQQQVIYQDQVSHQQQHQDLQMKSYEEQQNVVPTVEGATDQMWQCGTDDFRSGSLAIQLLRLAVVTDWEQRQQHTNASIDELMSFPYDPAEIFLSLQGAALRFRAHFDCMRAEGTDSLEWELTEQTAWEIWEESLRATAALAHASVGPGWHYQLQLRRQLNHAAELRSMYGPSFQERNQVIFDDFSDEGSSIGSFSFDASNPQSSHYSQRLRPPVIELMPSAVDTFRAVIPEVLPAAMIRFAASVIDCTPTLRDADSKIIWKEDQTQQQMQSVILQLINGERRWIRRMKRLGDTQRDLSFALFCVSAANRPTHNPTDQQQESESEWSIPRSHVPMATMICSWLTCCTIGWPVPKVFDEVPCHFEVEPMQPDPDDAEIEEHEDAPPTEIILPARNSSPNTTPVQPDSVPEVPVEHTSGLRVKCSYWSDIVSLSQKDWWYTLRVLRDCSDLVSSGWCPPPSLVGNRICGLLVQIALDGMSPIMHDSEEAAILPDEEICRESCAAESLALLKNLASRDVLPLDSVDLIATSLCMLLRASEKALSSAAIDESIHSNNATLEEEITIQRTFVASNSAELLWILLSTDRTCSPTCDALLNLIDYRINAEKPDPDSEETGGAISAVKALSAALWGDPPSVQGVPLLRYFWEYIIDIFGKALNSSAAVCDDQSVLFSLEIVLALRRLVDSEMVYGNGDLHGNEWESLINAINIGIYPWLDKKSVQVDTDELLLEIGALFTQMQCFFAKIPDIDTGFHPIIDEDARNTVHIHVLRQCVPRLKAEQAAGLSLAAIKSWSCTLGSNLPCRDGKWLRHATSFISEAFGKYNVECYHSFPGGYVHSPLARLEAFQSLFRDRGHTDQNATDGASIATSISAVTSGTGLSGSSRMPMLSLFTLTRNLRDLHLELINKLILPQILTILSLEFDDTRGIQPIPTASISPHHDRSLNTAETFDYVTEYLESEFLLLKFAVMTIGRLFKSRSGDGEKRQYYIRLLQRVALSKPRVISTWKISGTLHERLNLEIFRLKLEAIRQLEVCLHAPFRDLPHTHAAVPLIIQVLNDIAIHFSLEEKDKEESDKETDHNHTNSILCLAAIIPLGRLSCTRNGQGIFLPREKVTHDIPDVVLSVLGDDGWIESYDSMDDLRQLPMVLEEECSEATCRNDIAPFLYIKQHQTKLGKQSGESNPGTREESKRRTRRHNSELSDKTVIDVEPVANVIKRILCEHQTNINDDHAAHTDLSPIIRLVCFGIVSSFLSHGVSFPSHIEDKMWLGVEAQSVEELVAKSEAVSLLATNLGNVMLSKRLKIEIDRDLIIQTFEVLVRYSIEHIEHPSVVKNACCGLISLLRSMQMKARKDEQREIIDAELTVTLEPLIQQMCNRVEDHHAQSGSVLIPLINVTRQCIIYSGFDCSKDLCHRILLLCLKLNEECQWHLQVMIFFMGVEIIDLMQTDHLTLFLTLETDTVRSRIQPLLLDVLRSKILHKTLYKTGKVNREPFQVHTLLARKTIAIENYPFQADGVSAWKCGGTLLTLRLGSRSSLYRGWVEVLLRSASCTLRRLVKVDDISGDNPDNLLRFYHMLRTPAKDAPLTGDDSISPPKLQVSNKSVSDEERGRTLVEARDLIQYFDQMIQNGTEESEHLMIQSSDSHSMTSDSRANSFSSNNAEKSVETPVFKPKKLKRNVSDGNISHSLIEPKDDGIQNQLERNNVQSWMDKKFDGYSDAQGVIQDLEKLGFSSKALGSLLPTKCSSQVISHDKLKLCTPGTNLTRALSILDRATPFQTHRVSLLYGGPLSQKVPSNKQANTNATDGDQFLLATQASTDFWKFAKELGDFVPVRHLRYFSGGLDTSESCSDGSFTIVHFSCRGDSSKTDEPAVVDSMVMFHTVTLMPNKTTNRKRHVGNDIVHVVYGLESETLDVDNERLAISGHFGFVTIYVIPFVCIDMVKISIHLKNGLDESISSALSHLSGSRFVSRKISAESVRALAMEADLICLSMLEQKLGLVLNIEERAIKLNEMNRHLSK